MSKSLNAVQLIGNLGNDPEVRNVGKGKDATKVATISVATSRKWKDAKDKEHEKTEWHRVTLWGFLAELAEKYMGKGSKVFISGRIEYGSYDDKEGVTRYTTEIRADEVILLGDPKEAETSKGGRR